MAKTGIILCNIGTPRSYQVKDVKEYLLTFLMDKDIINIPFLIRWLLVHGIIVPRRAPFSAGNYKKIWMTEGSPLWVYSRNFANKLQTELGSDYSIKLGMRYSEPSIENALKELESEKVESILLIPMFPQYAEATTGSILKEFNRAAKKLETQTPVKIFPTFFSNDYYTETTATITKETLADQSVDHYLFSFHGLPESHVRKNANCLVSPDCCLAVNACEKPCYKAQCHSSAAKIAKQLNLSQDQWSVSFQSRLGRGEWLKPSTDSILESLAKSGKKNIAVLCPSFVADCIETLEEIAIGGQETFSHAGGETLRMIPCLNEDPRWVKNFAVAVQNF
jgi:ferrochelatase